MACAPSDTAARRSFPRLRIAVDSSAETRSGDHFATFSRINRVTQKLIPKPKPVPTSIQNSRFSNVGA